MAIARLATLTIDLLFFPFKCLVLRWSPIAQLSGVSHSLYLLFSWNLAKNLRPDHLVFLALVLQVVANGIKLRQAHHL